MQLFLSIIVTIMINSCDFHEHEIVFDHLFDTELKNVSVLENLRRFNYDGLEHLHRQQLYDFDNDAAMEIERKKLLALQTKQTTKDERYINRIMTPLPLLKPTQKNRFIENLKMRKRYRDIEYYYSGNVSSVPKLTHGYDDSSIITRRFDQIRAQQNHTKISPPFRREYYHSWYDVYNTPRKKRLFLNFMAHFVYRTRYKLPYSQLLRKKYNNEVKYQIGYNFALLRNLQRQQHILYMTTVKYRDKLSNVHVHLKIYDHILRLNVDIRDLLRLIYRLERGRKLLVSPFYYKELTTADPSKNNYGPPKLIPG